MVWAPSGRGTQSCEDSSRTWGQAVPGLAETASEGKGPFAAEVTGPEGPSPCGRHQAWRVVRSSRCPHSTDENTEAQGRRPQIR